MTKTGFQREDFFDALSRKPLANQGASLSNLITSRQLRRDAIGAERVTRHQAIIQTKRFDWLEAFFRELDGKI